MKIQKPYQITSSIPVLRVRDRYFCSLIYKTHWFLKGAEYNWKFCNKWLITTYIMTSITILGSITGQLSLYYNLTHNCYTLLWRQVCYLFYMFHYLSHPELLPVPCQAYPFPVAFVALLLCFIDCFYWRVYLPDYNGCNIVFIVYVAKIISIYLFPWTDRRTDRRLILFYCHFWQLIFVNLRKNWDITKLNCLFEHFGAMQKVCHSPRKGERIRLKTWQSVTWGEGVKPKSDVTSQKKCPTDVLE